MAVECWDVDGELRDYNYGLGGGNGGMGTEQCQGARNSMGGEIAMPIFHHSSIWNT